MVDSLSDFRAKVLRKRLTELQEEYEVASAQLSRTLSDVDCLRLRRHIGDLERQMDQTQNELRQMSNSNMPTRDEDQDEFLLRQLPVGDQAAKPIPGTGEEAKIPNEVTQVPHIDKPSRRLRVFLCHASDDRHTVRAIYHRLWTEGVDVWFSEESLLPGQDWRKEIREAVRFSDAVVLCLSYHSINKAGFVQDEIAYALDVANQQPPGTIFLIPVKLVECEVPKELGYRQWVNLFEKQGWMRLLRALQKRAEEVGAILRPRPKTRFVKFREAFPRIILELLQVGSKSEAHQGSRYSIFIQVVLGFAAGGITSVIGNALLDWFGIVAVTLAILVLAALVFIRPELKGLRLFVFSMLVGSAVAGLAKGFTSLLDESSPLKISWSAVDLVRMG